MSEDDRIALARLEEKVDSIKKSDEIYRPSLCEKITELKLGQIKTFEMLYALPCKVREEKTKQETRTQTLLWTGAWVTIGVIGGILMMHLGWK